MAGGGWRVTRKGEGGVEGWRDGGMEGWRRGEEREERKRKKQTLSVLRKISRKRVGGRPEGTGKEIQTGQC